MKQGTEEWLQARVGKITASRIADLVAETKSGPAASRKNYLAELLVERLTGEPTEQFVSKEMQRGIDLEPDARSLYELETGVGVDQVGFIQHPQYEFSGASPDGLIGNDGAIEIKCPNTATHIDTLRSRTVPSRYYLQIQWVLECAGRQWCDYVSYDPRMRDSRLTLCVQRVQRDESQIGEIRRKVEEAETELRQRLDEVQQIAGENDKAMELAPQQSGGTLDDIF